MADQPAQLSCQECEDDYCEVCFAAQHRKGTRKKHVVTSMSGSPKRTGGARNGVSSAMAGTADGERRTRDEVFGVVVPICFL